MRDITALTGTATQSCIRGLGELQGCAARVPCCRNSGRDDKRGAANHNQRDAPAGHGARSGRAVVALRDMTFEVRAGEVVFIKQEVEVGMLMARNNLVLLGDTEGRYLVKDASLGSVAKERK